MTGSLCLASIPFILAQISPPEAPAILAARRIRQRAEGSANIQCQRVNARGQIAKRLMHGAVACHAVHCRQFCRADRDVEMRLAALAPAAMTTVFFAIILYFQHFRVERPHQSLKNLIFHSHFYLCPLHAAAQSSNVGAPSRKGLS